MKDSVIQRVKTGYSAMGSLEKDTSSSQSLTKELHVLGTIQNTTDRRNMLSFIM